MCRPTFRRGVSVRFALNENNIATVRSELGTTEGEKQLSSGRLQDLRKHLGAELRRFKDGIAKGVENRDWPLITSAVRILYDVGDKISWDLFGEEGSRSLTEICYPLFIASKRGEPRLVEVDAPLEMQLPIEYLPLCGSKGPPDSITTREELEEALRSFIGFSAITKRIVAGPVSNADALENVPRLPLKLFHHGGLDGAKLEAAFFQNNSHSVDLEGPWPSEAVTLEECRSAVATHLFYPARSFCGQTRSIRDQIQHFSCHCQTTDTVTSAYYIKLSHDGGEEHEIYLDNLQARFGRYARDRARGDSSSNPRALVFLNACGASRVDPLGMTSFPELILKEIKGRGFIGPEIEIPDQFAADFSTRFYKELLGGAPLGDALYNTKWGLLKENNNPLGILYTMYADPDIQVRKPSKIVDC